MQTDLNLLNDFHGKKVGQVIIDRFGVDGFEYRTNRTIVYFPAKPKTEKKSIVDYLDSINELAKSGKIKLKKGEICGLIGSNMANATESLGPSLDYLDDIDKSYWDLLNSYIESNTH